MLKPATAASRGRIGVLMRLKTLVRLEDPIV